MKLWQLALRDISGPPSDRCIAFHVRADTELSARRFASEEPGNEGGFTWLDPALSTCEELTADGDAGVLMADFEASD